MGLAASQARFLQLTARRSNIEYQGQQINQQRLALANASAGLFEKMLSLSVPTPPSSQDDQYYKQGYTFEDKKDSNIQKNISWDTTEPTSAEILTAVGGAATGSIVISTSAATPTTISTAALMGTSATTSQSDALKAFATATEGSAPATGYTQVIRNVDITHAVYDPDGNYQTVHESGLAVLEFDNLNRLIDATMLPKASTDGISTKATDDGTAKDKSIGKGDSLTYASVFNSEAYQNDMNKYEFEKASYEYQVERLNQETKSIQVQDKMLELQMKQLDTEHNSIQTELDAVQKVIQKNIETSYKIFANG